MPTELRREGRRTYLLGAPYGAREALKAAGAHWDPDRKAWWIGSHERAMELAAQIDATEAEPAHTGLRDGDVLLGRGRYRGRGCLVLWVGETKAGRRCKCATMDGSRIFWAPADEVSVEKRYGGWTEDDQGREYQRQPLTWGRLCSEVGEGEPRMIEDICESSLREGSRDGRAPATGSGRRCFRA